MTMTHEITRRRLNSRRVFVDGYLRSDGRFEIEGQVVDTRDTPYSSPWLGVLPAGAPLHDMKARVVITDDYVITEIEVRTHAAPYPTVCPSIAPAFQRLVGASMLRDWSRTLHGAVGGTSGCTHLVELLGRMATVALHTVYLHHEQSGAWVPGTPRPEHRLFVDGCHVLTADSAIVRARYPVKPATSGNESAGSVRGSGGVDTPAHERKGEQD